MRSAAAITPISAKPAPKGSPSPPTTSASSVWAAAPAPVTPRTSPPARVVPTANSYRVTSARAVPQGVLSAIKLVSARPVLPVTSFWRECVFKSVNSHASNAMGTPVLPAVAVTLL